MNKYQRMSEAFNFEKEDAVCEDDFNRVIWWQ
jgi:hypothetical protein